MRTPDRLTIKTAAESPWAECEFSSIAEAIACAYNTAIHDAIALNHPALTRADGAAMIAFERRRQVDAEGWTPEHDDEHGGGELVDAAVALLRGRSTMTFPYFGRKARIAGLYPSPRYPLVVEPFAGSLAWSVHHRPVSVLATEADERVVALWREIMEDPAAFAEREAPLLGEVTEDLFSKLCTYSEHSLTSTKLKVTSRMLRDYRSLCRRAADAGTWAASALDLRHGSYLDLPDVEATWFIDPPYQKANRRGYREGAPGIDFDQLASWCRSRRGQIIVCEQAGADWLPFEPLASIATHRGATSSEVVWLGGTQ